MHSEANDSSRSKLPGGYWDNELNRINRSDIEIRYRAFVTKVHKAFYRGEERKIKLW